MTSPQTPRTPPRQLLRSRSHRLIAGVAGGIGQYLGVDAVIVRLAFVVLTLIGGLGALLYLAAWLIVPEDDTDPQDAEGAIPTNAGHTWIAIGALALLILLGGLGHWGFGSGFDGGVVWPLVVIGIGAAVLWVRGENTRVATVPVPTRTGTGSATATTAVQSPTTAPGPAGAPPSVAVRDPRRSSLIRRAAPVVGRAILVVVIGVVALIVSLLTLVALEGASELDVTAFEAIVVSGVALGLAIWLGIAIHRVPELVACALAVALVIAAAAWLEPPLHGGYGTRDIHPERAAAVRPSYQLAGGRLRLDLSDVTLARPTAVSMQLGVGLLQVVVPRGTTVVLDGHVGAGELCAFGRRDTGLGIDRSATSAARGVTSTGTAKTLHLRPQVGAGAIVVARTPLGLHTSCH